MEAIWTKIIGALLILLGLVLFASPYVHYWTEEHLRNTPLSVRREKNFAVPRPVSAGIIVAGVVALILASRKPRQ
jgi:uncharacterized membrane protein YidH (DUF202 family)